MTGLRLFPGNLFAQVLDALFPQRKAMAELRAAWGKAGTKVDGYASEYFDLVRDLDPTAWVDDKTWSDLEFPQIFASMDSTVTPLGSQALFRQMREYVHDADVLAEKHEIHVKLQADGALREKLQRKLLPLRDDSHGRIAEFLFGDLPPPLKHAGLLRWWSLASLVVLAAAAAWSWWIWGWLAMVAVNVAIMVRVGASGRSVRDVQTLQACLQLVKVANDLALMHANHPCLPQLAGLQEEAANRETLRRPMRRLSMWRSLAGMFPVSIAVAFLNVALLVELVLHVRAIQRFAGLRHKLAASFELVGGIDAAIAIASWLVHCPDHCPPVLADRAVLEIRGGRHPLLAQGVANSVRLVGRSALVTGSNMAGKTTFIKMAGVNALLGQTLGFCLASSATIPRSRVMASIQAAHSVASGKSHYFSEVETIQSFLARQTQGGCTIFVIDELFSGTNTVERVAIARAVLESLGRHALVLATTHDVELQAFLDEHYDLYHFQESPEVDGFFDYQLRSGPATARNAIRLLGEIGFPGALVTQAMAYAKAGSDPAAQGVGADRRTASAEPARST